MTVSDINEYNLISIAILGYDINSQITVAHVTLPKAVLSKYLQCNIRYVSIQWSVKEFDRIV